LTSQLFESTSLEEALADVRDTIGPHAKIVRAEKVRRGGIGGFFSKETFVLSVEAEDASAGTGESFRMVPTPAAELPAEYLPAAYLPAAYSLDALADLADGDDGAVGRLPAVSTETPLFGQVLQEVSRATALDFELPAGPRWDGRLLDVEATYRSVMPLAPAPSAPATPPVPAKTREIALEPFPDAPPQQPWWQVLADVAQAQAAPAGAQQPLTIDLQALPLPPAPPAGPPRLGADAITELLAEHAPTALPTAEVSDLAASLATINAALGPALLPGSVIAVVGHPADAGEVAARVAVAAAADPFAIHFASHDPAAREASGLPGGRQICSLDEAILRSRRWPSRPTPMVIVVDGRDSRWARTVLDAIETTTVVALPSPTDDEAAVRAWVAALGGVQALLVDDSCRTSPESLALHGIPALRSPWSLDRPAAESGEL
jgi:hypothetical protein